jgi:hypothetical protein
VFDNNFGASIGRGVASFVLLVVLTFSVVRELENKAVSGIRPPGTSDLTRGCRPLFVSTTSAKSAASSISSTTMLEYREELLISISS